MADAPPVPGKQLPRARGGPVLVAIVIAGMAIPTFYLWKVPRLKQEADRLRVEASEDPEGRLRVWYRFAQPQVHNALIQARFSAERPWFVTHVVLPPEDGDEPEIWGIDFTDLAVDVLQVEGMTARLSLPTPSLLGRGVLRGDKALGVPVYAHGVPIPDPRALAKGRIERYVDRIASRLPMDIPGASMTVEVGGMK